MTDHGSPLFAALRADCRPDWEAYTRHRFVSALGDGSLPRSCYLHYLRQDYLFLIHFARAWSLAAAKADRIGDIRRAAATVHGLVDDEMKLHVETCAAEGIDRETLLATEEGSATLAYTRFVIDAGFSGDLLDLLAALMPCSLGYGEIGAALARDHAETTPYADWIATYGSEGYQSLCRDAAAFFESVAARRIGPDFRDSPRWPDLVATFRTACRLEAYFWEAGLAIGNTRAAA
ncbi:thiaminase II [Pikeienuella piscinae]|uniref:Thiaminase II n=1 Tax=Pikeienuella piscinae TaxID=2748098 RepID=A0A7L5BV39_9RHOB|nr:TenA family protein [Pikeienuella piscinae]QIE54648.1 thiaminase II [Pikeienuella piscinae]